MRGRDIALMVDRMVYRGDKVLARSAATAAGLRKARSREKGRGACAARRHVREELSNRTCELEAVAGAGRGVRDRSVAVDDEMRVRAVGVQADLRAATFTVRQWHSEAQPDSDALLVLRARLAVDRVWIDAVAEMEARHLESAGRVVREPVAEAVGGLDDIDRQLRERIELTARFEPEEHVPLDPQIRGKVRQQPRQPGAGRDHETLRAVAALGGGHAYAIVVALPALDRLGEAQRRAVPLRETQMRFDRAFRREPTRLRVGDADPVGADIEDRIASPELRVVDELVSETMSPRARERSRHELTVRRTHVQTAGLREQRLSAVALELAPQVPGALKQRHVARVFVVGEPDDARQTTERGERVAARKAIESKNGLTALREVIRRRAAVRAHTHDDRVPHRCQGSGSPYGSAARASSR